MKHRVKTYISAFCLVCVLTMAISGCGSNNANADKTEKSTEATMKQSATPTPTVAETPTPTPEPTETAPVFTIKNTEPGTLTWMGHATVKLKSKSGKVIYIDPNYDKGDYAEKADFILVTHPHDDHIPCAAVKANDKCVTITCKEGIVKGKYQKFDYGDIQVEAVPAGGNGNHALGNGVGYIVTVDGVTVYHAGDTSMVDDMKKLTKRKLDYAMYPIDGLYNMSAREATEVATLVSATHNIPIHDMNGFKQHKEEKFVPEGKLVLAKGETIYLESK